MKKTGLIVLSALLLCSGCRMVSPLMLETPASKSSAGSIPLSIGIEPIQKSGGDRISDIDTYQMLGLMAYKARMPRRSETDYVNKSICTALRSSGLFKYVYATPFEKEDVDLILKVKLSPEAECGNSMYGTGISHAGFIPTIGTFINIGQLIGVVPMEQFSVQWTMQFDLYTKNGKLLDSCKHTCSDSEFVNMWKQPFGNYMWYDSIFLNNFQDAINRFSASVRSNQASLKQF